MFSPSWTKLNVAALVAVLPLAMACEPADQGFDDQPDPAQQPGEQVPPDQQMPPGQDPAAEAPEIPEEELEEFAEVYLEVAQVEETMIADMQDEEDPAEIERIQAAGQERFVEILDEHGVTMQEFQQVMQTLQMDPEQRQKFERILMEKEGEVPGAR